MEGRKLVGGMDDLIRREGVGWKQISGNCHQFIGKGGYGFCTWIEGEWKWEFHPEKSKHPQASGTRSRLEEAKQAVQNCHSMSKDAS